MVVVVVDLIINQEHYQVALVQLEVLLWGVVDLLAQYHQEVKDRHEKLVELVVIGVKMVRTPLIQEMVEQRARQSTDRQMFQLVV